MRLYEIDARVADDILMEGFLDSLKQAIGDKVNDAVRTVNNMQTAMVVMYRVCTNDKYRDIITNQILKSIRTKLKELAKNPIFTKIVDGVKKMMPTNTGLGRDFIKAVVLMGLVNVAVMMFGKLKDFAKETVGDQITDFIQNAATKIFSLDGLINSVADASGLMRILQGLGVADEVLFQTLDYANRKITSIPVGVGRDYA